MRSHDWHQAQYLWTDMTRKIRKVNRCRPVVSNKTIPETGQEFFFTKVAPVQSITGIVLFDFWLMLLSWMFTSSYTIMYFFLKIFVLSNIHISVNTILKCLYMFSGWGKEHQLSKYATVRTNHRGQSNFSGQKLDLFFQS